MEPLNIVFFSDHIESYDDTIPTPYSEPALRLLIFPNTSGFQIKFWYHNFINHENNVLHETIDILQLNNYISSHGKSFYDKITNYISTLSDDDFLVIKHEYKKYKLNFDLLHLCLIGMAAYSILIHFNDNSIFNLPFQIFIPNDQVYTRSMFKYITTYLIALSRISVGPLLQLVSFLLSFVNIWDLMFIRGPEISISDFTKISVDIITGVSSHMIHQFDKISRHHDDIKHNLQKDIGLMMAEVRRDVHNLFVETKSTIYEMIENQQSCSPNYHKNITTIQNNDQVSDDQHSYDDFSSISKWNANSFRSTNDKSSRDRIVKHRNYL